MAQRHIQKVIEDTILEIPLTSPDFITEDVELRVRRKIGWNPAQSMIASIIRKLERKGVVITVDESSTRCVYRIVSAPGLRPYTGW